MVTEILTQLTTTAVVIAIAGWFLKTWITHQFDNFHTKSAHNLALELEAVRAQWAKHLARLNVHEGYLHTRRVNLIEEMHKQAIEAEFSLQNFLVSWWALANKGEILQHGLPYDEHFEAGCDTSMKKRSQEFCERYLEINATLHKNAIFFEERFIEAVRDAYQPFFDRIVNIDYEQPPPMPEEYKDLIKAGRAPRHAVVGLFRTMLGVSEGNT